MRHRRRLKIASRIDLLLQAEIGHGIDVRQMTSEPLYARDVLLVCDALNGSELAALAAAFRRSPAEAAEDPGAADAEVSGFKPSRFFNSIFGMLSDAVSTASDPATLGPPQAPAARPRRRLGWARGRDKGR